MESSIGNTIQPKITESEITNSAGKFEEAKFITALCKQGRLFVKKHEELLYLQSNKSPVLYSILSNNVYGRQIIQEELIDPSAAGQINSALLQRALRSVIEDARFFRDMTPCNDSVMFNNGILCLEGSEPNWMPDLKHPKTEKCFTYQVDAEYRDGNVSLEDAPEFKNYLETSLHSDVHDLFLESIGFLLSPIQKMKKAILLIGRPNTGKSLILEVVQKLLGSSSVSLLDLAKIGTLNENGDLMGKQLNISGDIDSTKTIDMNTFKSAVANEPIGVSRKFENTITAPIRAKFAIASNSFPKVPSQEIKPFIERIVFIPFDRTVENPDPKLLDKLWQEKDIIVTLAINKFLEKFKMAPAAPFDHPPLALKKLDYYLDNSNPAGAFIRDCLMEKGGVFIPTSLLLTALNGYCARNGFDKPNNRTIKEVMLQNISCEPKKKNLTTYGLGNVHGFEGITFKPEALEYLTEGQQDKFKKYFDAQPAASERR